MLLPSSSARCDDYVVKISPVYRAAADRFRPPRGSRRSSRAEEYVQQHLAWFKDVNKKTCKCVAAGLLRGQTRNSFNEAAHRQARVRAEVLRVGLELYKKRAGLPAPT